MLGCPNLPAAALGDDASVGTSAEHAGEPGVGCLFAAVRGGGAYVGPLSGLPFTMSQLTKGGGRVMRCTASLFG